MKAIATLTTKLPLQKELLELLKNSVLLHSVYVLSIFKEKKKQNVYLSPQGTTSKKEIIYTLLIITHKPISKSQGNFMDDLYNKMQQRCKVFAIMYTLSKVKKRLNYGDDFLSKVIFNTLYQNLAIMVCIFIHIFINVSKKHGRVVWSARNIY